MLSQMVTNHIEYGSPMLSANLSEINEFIKKNYNNEILIGSDPYNKINVTKLSTDVGIIASLLNELIIHHNTALPVIDPEKEEMKERILQLEDTIRKIEFMVGEN